MHHAFGLFLCSTKTFLFLQRTFHLAFLALTLDFSMTSTTYQIDLPVSATGQTKLKAGGKGSCVPGLHSLASQGTEQGGQGWRVGLQEQEVKAQQGSPPFTLLG